jgi:hypothetical protein
LLIIVLYAPFCSMPTSKLELTHLRIFGRVHVALHGSNLPVDDPAAPFAYFLAGSDLVYQPFCNDFGPMNLLMLHKFCRNLDDVIQHNPHRSTALSVSIGHESQTSAALLLGTYMVMRLDFASYEATKRLAPLNPIPFRDILPRGLHAEN